MLLSTRGSDMKYLIMHGSFGSPDENWFRWLEKELKQKKHQVILEQFPVDNWDKLTSLGIDNREKYKIVQTVASWEKFFLDNIYPKLKNQEFVFVGHSLAPLFLLHLLEKYDLKINKAIFVAPFFELEDQPDIWQFYPVNKDFYKTNFDFSTLKSKIKKSVVVYGDNDPYVPLANTRDFIQKLEAKELMISGGGHCGSIFREFPEILELLV